MSRRARFAVAALLAALCAHHLGNGRYYLTVQQPASGIEDFRHVRVWSAYFLDGVSPQSQNFLFLSQADPPHTLPLFAVLAVISRLFTYHRAHDDTLLAFVMIALSRCAFGGGRSRAWQLLWARPA